MTKQFELMEDVVADEQFQAWYFKENEVAIRNWEEWLLNHPEMQSLVKEAVLFMQQLPAQEIKIPDALVDEKLTLLNGRLHKESQPVFKMRSHSGRNWWTAAAAVVIIAGIISFQLFTPIKHKEIKASYGSVINNTLPDGSTMILNANSTAKLSKDWEQGRDREIWLDGEAFFHVTKTPEKSRFIVHTGELDVIVTGTQFNVMNRNHKTSVLLTEGSVLIRTNDGKELAMKPGDFVEINASSLVRKDADSEDVLAWKENKISFNATPLRDVAQTITDHYGVKVKFADEAVAFKTINGIMPNDNLDVLLQAIEMTESNVHIRKTNNEIIFSADK